MNSEIDNAVKRARAYWFVDGFTEVVAGIFFLLLAGLLLFSLNTPATFPAWFVSTAVEISIVKLVGLLIAILLLWWLKDRFTYPRTGFVRGKRLTMTQILSILRDVIVFLLLPILGLLAISLLSTSPVRVLASMPVWFPVVIGILWAYLLILAARRIGLPRFRVLGVLILLAGIMVGIRQYAVGLPVIPANMEPGILQPQVLESLNRSLSSLCYLIMASGVILIVSGTLTFMRYRKENPAPYGENV